LLERHEAATRLNTATTNVLISVTLILALRLLSSYDTTATVR
jgi:hypothetical protein